MRCSPPGVLARFSVSAVAAAAIACAGSGSPLQPSSSGQAGATIQGTVASGGASIANAKFRVSVMSTTLTTMSDDAGRFSIANVPAGTARVRFEGPGGDAQLEVTGLQNGQVLSIDVQVTGSQATVVSGPSASPTPRPSATPSPEATPSPSPRPSPSASPENETEFRGTIESIGSNRLVVAGRSVRVDGNTRIQRSGNRISFSDLKVGNSVEVEGLQQPDWTVLARKIGVEDGGNDDDDGKDDDDDEGGDDN